MDIRFGGYRFSKAAWGSIQSTLDCWATGGEWVPKSPNDPPGHVLDAAHLMGYHLDLSNFDNPSLNLTWAKRPGQPACDEAFTVPTRDAFCSALGGRNVLLVGDSLDMQFHDYIQGLNFDQDTMCRELVGGCAGHMLCYKPGAPYKPAYFHYRRNDRLLVNSTGFMAAPLPENLWQDGWTHLFDSHNFSIVILNRGVHVRQDDEVTAQLRETLSWLEARPHKPLVLWRSTIVGHPECSRIAAPLLERDRRIVDGSAPHQWGDAIRQSLGVVKPLLQREYGNLALWFDVDNATALRPDSHSYPPYADCLHYKLPGPIDWWLRLLHNTVRLLDKANAYGRYPSEV